MSASSLRAAIISYLNRGSNVVFFIKLFLIIAVSMMIGAVVILGSGFGSKWLAKGPKAPFTNKSNHGFYYETDDLRMVSPNDRSIARNALVSELTKLGFSYTLEQVSTLSDSMLLTLLEPDDDIDVALAMAKLVILLDPTYKAVQTSIITARSNGNKFANDAERQAVFDLLTKYFVAIKTPLGIPLSQWSDYILIKTFSTLKAPALSEMSYSPTGSSKSKSVYNASSSFAMASAARKSSTSAADAMTIAPAPLFSSVSSA